MLSLSRLQLLHELSVLGTITAVARSMNLTRSAVSQQLSLLEKEVGTTLFERSAKGVHWTAAGENLVERVRGVLLAVVEIESELARSTQEVVGELRLAAFGSVATTIVPYAMAYLMRQYPTLRLSFTEMEPVEGLKAVTTKQVDIAIVDDLTKTEAYSTQLDFQSLYEDSFKAVLSVDHRLAASSRKTLDLVEFADEKWALNHAAVSYEGFIVNACQKVGYTPQIVASSRNIAATLELVRTGHLVTVLPSLATQNILNDPDFCCLDLNPALSRRISIALLKGSRTRPVTTAAMAAFEKACALYD